VNHILLRLKINTSGILEMKHINDFLKGLIFKMSDIDEIKKLMERLSESERDKENASKKCRKFCKNL
jgi:hypothetical protein